MKRIILSALLLSAQLALCTDDSPITLVLSVPKCGTHLVKNIIGLLTGKKPLGWLNPRDALLIDETKIIKYGVKHKIPMISHLVHTNHNITLLKKYGIKSIFIIRDPRDMIISNAFWIFKKEGILQPSQAQINKKILEIISYNNGAPIKHFLKAANIASPKTIVDFYHIFMPWANEPNVYTTTFEKLIGEYGGGSKKAQITEIINIAQHLGITCTERQAEKIAQQAFGESPTFRDGQIGSWKKYFNDEHTALFKRVAGNLLANLGYSW